MTIAGGGYLAVTKGYLKITGEGENEARGTKPRGKAARSVTSQALCQTSKANTHLPELPWPGQANLIKMDLLC